ncbi:MAG: hypothetical protein LBM04_02220 [Opitutaceae bacterium]|nr:hypothetical protein [Opitutaceae bacterium]
MKIPVNVRFSFPRGCVLLMVSVSVVANVFAVDWSDGAGRLTAGFVQSLRDENTGAAVVGISYGSHFGKNDTSEMSFEWFVGRWKTQRYDRFDNLIDTTRELQMPVTLNYRHYVRVPRTPVTLYAGAGAGLHMTSNSFSPEFFRYEYDSGNEDLNVWYEIFRRFDYSVTASGMVGFMIKVAERSGIDIGVRWSWQSGAWHTFDDDTGGVAEEDRRVRTRQDYTRMVTVGAHWVF